MNPSQTKLTIFAIQCVDWVMVSGLCAYLIYAYLHSYRANYMITVGLVGLVIIHQFGQWSITKIAYLRQTLKRLETPPQIR